MNQIEADILTSIGTALCSAVAAIIIAKVQKDQRLANLAGIIQVADDALQAAIGAVGNAPRQQILSYALTAAMKVLAAEKPKLVAASEAEIGTLVHGRQALMLAPGGAVVAMPSLVPGGAS
jgi:uncharacterized protein YsxB (DUF464 family)